ncbi:MAG: hypothetical protein ABI478_14035 [Propionivibrio sp.]
MITWFIVQSIGALVDVVAYRHPLTAEDNLQARSIQTKVKVLARIAMLIVEGEWGKVEEITETYVVISIWDERRLIVLLEYFIQKPFQNWTRASAQLIGSVFFWVDFRMPVAPLREKLQELAAADPGWDGRVVGLQVTDVSENSMQLRALVSAEDAGKTFDIRCRIREQMIAYMQENYADMLPVTRAIVRAADGGQGRAGAFDALQPAPANAGSGSST